jgi:ribonuclease P protein component
MCQVLIVVLKYIHGNETHLSAQKSTSCPQTRFHGTQLYSLGAKYFKTTSSSWSCPSNRIMLPKTQRLSHFEFFQTKKHGKQLRNDYFSIVVFANNLAYSRFSVVTSAKISKSAVTRNRLRRQIYQHLNNCKLIGMDIIIFPRPEVLKLEYEEFSSHLDSLLSKVSFVSVGA